MSRLVCEVMAFLRTFRFTEGNSREQKVALWVAMFLFVVGVVGSFFGVVDLENGTNRLIFEVLLGVMAWLWGRTQGHEVALVRQRRPPLK